MKISIITTISNEVNKIKFTMDSVMLQSYENYEHIIIYNDIVEDALKFISTYSKNTILFYFCSIFFSFFYIYYIYSLFEAYEFSMSFIEIISAIPSYFYSTNF